MLFLIFVFTCTFRSDMIIIYWIKCKLQKAELDLKITNKIWDGNSFGIVVLKVTLSMRGSRKAGVGMFKFQTYLLHIVKLPNFRDLRSAQVSAAVKMS